MNTNRIRWGDGKRSPTTFLTLGACALIILGVSLAGCSSTSSRSGGSGGSGGSSTSAPATSGPSGSSGATGSPPSSSPPELTAASVAATWLAGQFGTTGDLPSSQGSAGLNNVPLALVALVASGGGHSSTEKAGLKYLESNFQSFVSLPAAKKGGKSTDAPGRLAEVILAAVATGADPTRFGGTASKNDLVARLLATGAKSGTDRGLFGSPSAPTYSSAYTQGLAVLALAAAGHPDLTAANWLMSQQCADGGWTSYRSSTSTPCPAANPKTYTGPDTNSTAAAVEALSLMQMPMLHDSVRFFSQAQYPNGGFSYYGVVSKGQSVDPDSTALVVQALLAIASVGDPALGRGTAVTRAESELASFQLVCGASVAERGAFTFPGTKGPSLLATIQAIPAAAGLAYPVRPGQTGTPITLAACGAGFRDGAHAATPERAHHATTAVLMSATSLRPHCASIPKSASGQVVVPVVIDFGRSSSTPVKVTCVSVRAGASGAVALAAALTAIGGAAPVYASSGLLCSIDAYPASGCGAPSGTHYAYWSYFHGGAHWSYAENGPAATTVQAGDVEGWRFQPNGTATPSDPAPRAASSVQALEAGAVAGAAAAGGAAGSGTAAPSGGGTGTIQLVLVALGALLAIGGLSMAFVRTRRTRALSG